MGEENDGVYFILFFILYCFWLDIVLRLLSEAATGDFVLLSTRRSVQWVFVQLL